ncbi:hypothetical protein B5S33_g4147 [[Candida] boidinii]|nr:hypothetical protein B5S33_g4147 [[Candida] boidinii]
MDIHRCRFIDYSPQSITSSAFSHRSTNALTPKDLKLAIGRAGGSIEIWSNHGSNNKWLREQTLPGGKERTIESLIWANPAENLQQSTSTSNSTNSTEQPRLFSIGGSNSITEWDIKHGIPIINYDCNAGVIWSISINSKQDKLAVGCEDGTVVVIDISGGRGVMEHELILQRQNSRVLSLTWYNNDMIIGGCSDGRVRCWSYDDSSKGRLISTLRVDKSQKESTLVWSVLALPKDNQLVTGDSTGCVKFWDLKHSVLKQSFNSHEADVLCLCTDLNENKIFSAGVDRKIFNFTKISNNNKKNSKWVNSSNRLLHSNDVRTMTCFESAKLDLLVSGGVESVITLNSIKNFQNSSTQRLPMNNFPSNIIINENKKLIAMWQDQTVKIWRLKDKQHDNNNNNNQNENHEDENHDSTNNTKKLVAKLTLSDEDNIISCSISENGRYLVVARLSSIKLFELIDLGKKLQVLKVSSKLLENSGAKLIKFNELEKLIVMITPDNLVKSVKFDTEDDEEDEEKISEFDDEQDILEYKERKTANDDEEDDDEEEEEEDDDEEDPSIESNYSNLEISKNGKYGIISKFNGLIKLINFKNNKLTRLIKLNEIPTSICFNSNNNEDSIFVISFNKKILEINLNSNDENNNNNNNNGGNLITSWSKINSNNLPQSFINLIGQCYKMFTTNTIDEETKSEKPRLWCFGHDWVAFFDITGATNSTTNTNNNNTNKKRTRNGSMSKTENPIISSNSSVPDEFGRFFWTTKKYKNLLYVNKISNDELVVVERPISDINTTPAFNLSKINL